MLERELWQWAADVVASLDEHGRPNGAGRRPAPSRSTHPVRHGADVGSPPVVHAYGAGVSEFWALVMGALLATAGGALQTWLATRLEDRRHRRERLDAYRPAAVDCVLDVSEAVADMRVILGPKLTSNDAKTRLLNAWTGESERALIGLSIDHPEREVRSAASNAAEVLNDVWLEAGMLINAAQRGEDPDELESSEGILAEMDAALRRLMAAVRDTAD